jgi:hypothetical protein
MLTRQDNHLVTRVGPGRSLGRLIREYWLPFPVRMSDGTYPRVECT